MKENLLFTDDRDEKYKKDVKQYWNETYKSEGFSAAYRNENEEKSIETARREMEVILNPLKSNVIKALKDPFYPIKTFHSSFSTHKPIEGYLGNLKYLTALEFGAGWMGRYSRALSKHFSQVIAVDVSEEALQAAQRINKDIDNIYYYTTNGVDLEGIEDGTVDFVFSSLVFQHIGAKEVIFKLTKELSRVIKKDGVIRANYSDSEDRRENDYLSPYHGNGFTQDEIKEMYEECGLETLTITEDKPWIWMTGRKL